MKRFLKGAAAFAISMIVNIIIHVICNMNGVDLNDSIGTTMVTVICTLLIYHGLTRNEK